MVIKQIYAHYSRREPPAGNYQLCPRCGAPLLPIEVSHRLRQACPKCGFIQHRNPAPSVAILITNGDQVLLGKRQAPPQPGKWALPSGYIDYEEDFLSAAIREAHEETGLEVKPGSILNVVSSFVSPSFHFICIYLAARVVGGELQAGDDLVKVAWFPAGGPLPELAFQEDADLLARYTSQGIAGLPIESGPARGE